MIAHDAHSVQLRFRKRPEKCRAGRADQGEFVDLRVLVPVEFDDALVGNAPITQVRTDTERNDERGPLAASQRDDGVDVEVVVMVVADDDRVQGRQRFQRHRRRMHPRRADDVRGRAAFTPHRVGQNAVAVDLQQRRRVAEPADRDLARRGLEGSGLLAWPTGSPWRGGWPHGHRRPPTALAAVPRGRC